MNSKWMINTFILILSAVIGVLLYGFFLIDFLPKFFPNMEGIGKNIIAIAIVVLTIYTLMKIIFNVDTPFDGYLLLLLYLLVLVIGLLRPDQGNFSETGSYAWNPFGFVNDIEYNATSVSILIINLIIFLPMYFLFTYTKVFKGFW